MFDFWKRFTVQAGLVLIAFGGCLWPCSAAVTLVGVPEDTPTYYLISGSGTWATAIDTQGLKLQVDATKKPDGATMVSTRMTISGNITAGEYRQVDLDIGSSLASGQSGVITLNGGTTTNISGNFTTGGHTTTNIGTTGSTTNVTVTGQTIIGSSMTSTLNIAAGSVFSANGGFYQNASGSQGQINVSGTLNLNSTADGSVRLGDKPNFDYTSTLTINSGGVLNVLSTTAHCGYDGQLFFKLNAGGTANLLGMTFAQNGDSGTKASVGKTLQLLGGTLNLGANGISVRSGKTSYPFQLKSGTISTLDGTTATTIQDVELGIGSGTVQFAPKTGAVMTVSSAINDSTWADVGTGGQVQMTGAGTLDVAGTFNTTGGFKAVSGKTVISGDFAGGELLTGGGAIEITGTVSGGTQTFTTGTVNVTNTAEITGGTMNVSGDAVVSVAGTLTGGALNVSGGTVSVASTTSAAPYQITVKNGGKLTLAYSGTANKESKAPITVEAGGTLTLSMPETNTSNIQYHHPITLNGGLLTTNKVGSSDTRFRNVYAPITLTADSEIKTVSNRIEVRANIVGNGHTLTVSGNDVILDQVGRGADTGLGKIVSTAGMLCLQSNAQRALVTTEGTFINSGKLQLWSIKGIEGNVFFNGGSFESNGSGDSSTAASAVFTFQKNTNFSTSTYDATLTPSFTMNGKLVAASGITLNKTGTRPMILAGDLGEFHGTLQSSSSQINFRNGGNTEATAYDFTTKLNGGSAAITDSGTYFFKGGTEIVNFANTANSTFDLGSGTIRNLGDASTISSSVASALIDSDGGFLDLGSTGSKLTFNVTSGALTVREVHTQGGAYAKTGTGTLTIEKFIVDGAAFDPNTSLEALSASVATITVPTEGKLRFDSAALQSALAMSGTFQVDVTGTNQNWQAEAMKLESTKNIQINPETVFELTTAITGDLNLDQLLGAKDGILLLTAKNTNLEGLSFDVLAPMLNNPELHLFAVGDASGNVTLYGTLPEPSAWLLLLAGAFGLFPLRRRFKK